MGNFNKMFFAHCPTMCCKYCLLYRHCNAKNWVDMFCFVFRWFDFDLD